MKKTASIKWTAILLSLFMLMTMIPAIGVTAAEGNVLFTKDTYTSAGTGSWNGYKNFYTYSGTGGVVVEYTVAPATADDAAKNAPTMLQFDVSGTTYQFMIKTNGIFLNEGATTPASAAGTFDLSKENKVKVVVHGNKIAGWVNDVLYVVYTMGTEYAGGNFGIFGNKCNITITNLTVSESTVKPDYLYALGTVTTTGSSTWNGHKNFYTYPGTGDGVVVEYTFKQAPDSAAVASTMVQFAVAGANKQLMITTTGVSLDTSSAAATFDFTQENKVKMVVHGDKVACWVNDVLYLVHTMSTEYTGGTFGIYARLSNITITNLTVCESTVKPEYLSATGVADTRASGSWFVHDTAYIYNGEGASLHVTAEPKVAGEDNVPAKLLVQFPVGTEGWQFVIEPTQVVFTRNGGGTVVSKTKFKTDLSAKNVIRVDVYNNHAAIWINDVFVARGQLEGDFVGGGKVRLGSNVNDVVFTNLIFAESPYQNDIAATTTVMDCTTAGIRDRLENNCQGLRFFEALNTTLKDDGTETVTVNGAEYTVNEVYVLVSTEKYLTETLGKTADDLTVGLLSNSQKVKQAKIEKYRSRTEENNTVSYLYSALLTNIPQSAKDQYVCARTYLVCTDAAGNTVEIYGVVKTTSVLDMYNAIIEKDPTGSEFKDASAMQEWMEV